MNTTQLRQKILDLAICGKLVPQDPNDEPVVVIGDNSNNLPFEIPETWSAPILSEICDIVTGSTPSKQNKSYYGNEYPFYKPTDLDNCYNVFSAEDMLSSKGFEVSRKLPANTVLVTCIGATIGKTGIIRNVGCSNQQINAILPKRHILAEFIYFICISDFFQEQIHNNASATTLPILNKGKMGKLIFLLPPLAEQHRIVAAIESTFTVIDEIERNKAELQAAVTAAKQKILSLAIQGKLVPQDPNDVPAAILLKQIKSTKMLSGKPKNIIVHSDITKYILKDLPNNWAVCRLSEIGKIVGGGTPSTANENYWLDGNISWITPADLSGYSAKYISKGNRNITVAGLLESSAVLMPANSVLFSSRAPIGYCMIAKNEVCTNQGFKSIVPYVDCMSEYIYYFLKAQTEEIRCRASGTTFKEISSAEFGKTIIALPPLAEQKRIVSAIEAAFVQLDKILVNLNKTVLQEQ